MNYLKFKKKISNIYNIAAYGGAISRSGQVKIPNIYNTNVNGLGSQQGNYTNNNVNNINNIVNNNKSCVKGKFNID